MANSSISISSIVITSVISFSVAVSSVSYATSYNDAVVVYDYHSISGSFFIVPSSILPEQQVTTTHHPYYKRGKKYGERRASVLLSFFVEFANINGCSISLRRDTNQRFINTRKFIKK